MPTEHEFKFVLSLDIIECAIFNSRPTVREDLIQQGYLARSESGSTRIRQYDIISPRWFFTFKHKVNNRTIEIETEIDQRDGKDLWSICEGKLQKARWTFEEIGFTWEVDILYSHMDGKAYFALMEVELEEGELRPSSPDWLRPYILYEVPLTDNRFSNKKLGDVAYAKQLYADLTNKE